ncbi:alkyl hydroperoxide reductase/ thiol specific antioxidant/ Mal allergen [Spinellus fusiger]|nr:alkyl hydroperoxide reductase/ thiol specific antioxidant/ Mal allergen [Spinellus fusiger]
MPHPLLHQLAPKDFLINDQKSEPVDLSKIIGNGSRAVVLFFYPKDNTFGCTKEVCSFRDNYEKLSELNATVIGVSSDSSQSHEVFSNKHQLPFTLLADEAGVLREGFKVPKWYFGMPGRTTYVIDKEGVVQEVFDSQIKFHQHVASAIKALS